MRQWPRQPSNRGSRDRDTDNIVATAYDLLITALPIPAFYLNLGEWYMLVRSRDEVEGTAK